MRRYSILRDLSGSAVRRSFASSLDIGVFAAGLAGAPMQPRRGQPVPEMQIDVAELSEKDARDARRDPFVVDVAPTMSTKLIAPFQGTVAANIESSWGVNAVGAAHSPYDGSGVRVAVLDTGIESSHPAFDGVNLTEMDFTGSGNGDVQGHGTHVAGTVFGRDVAGTRIGVARGVTDVLIGKVLDNGGGGTSEMLFNGMQWAAREGAQVISMSLGFDFPGWVKSLIENQNVPADLATSVALEDYRRNIRMFDAILTTIEAREPFSGGTIVCGAAGNEALRDIHPDYEISVSVPSAALGVISVGALGESDDGLSVTDFSNTGPTVSAPGENILSAALGGGLVAWNGTSMACPHVAGVAALWWQAVTPLGLPRSATSVSHRLMGATRPGVFAPGVDIEDRGQGLVTAPV
ncbi:MAG: S8 family serine peptidase [Alphaproteobacteria bacterium]|nr:S8 family serine peptidase [Alphaproteobacteria bacterium]